MTEMTVEQARPKLGDLVIAAMRGQSTTITRYGKPAARIVPIEETPMRSQDIADQITRSLESFEDDFDIEAIVEEIGDTYGRDLASIDDIPGEEYWAIVKRHDTTATA